MSLLQPGITLSPKSQIIVTPQMRLALGILQAPAAELRRLLDDAWTANPFLEMDSPAGDVGNEGWTQRGEGRVGPPANGGNDPAGEDESNLDPAAYGSSFVPLDGSRAEVATTRGGWEDGQWIESLPDDRETWQAKALAQFRLEDRDPRRTPIAEHLLGCLDGRGYLRVPVAEIAAALGTSPRVVEAVRRTILALDPPGLGARSVAECLAAQLEHLGRGGSLAARIVARHLPRLAMRRFAEIAASEGVAETEVREAAREIRALSPHPAGAAEKEEGETAIPDLFVVEVGTGFEVLLNDRALPGVRVVPPGGAWLAKADEATRAFAAQHLAEARWLLGSLDARRRTLVALMRRIVEEQQAFFQDGVEALRPLAYRRVAATLGVHESTIARAVRGKVVETPRGCFPLRFFFTYGLSTEHGEEWTPAMVGQRIRELIAGERGEAPLSDEAIALRLHEQGLRIARRTVAKYRDRLGIPRAMHRGPF